MHQRRPHSREPSVLERVLDGRRGKVPQKVVRTDVLLAITVRPVRRPGVVVVHVFPLDVRFARVIHRVIPLAEAFRPGSASAPELPRLVLLLVLDHDDIPPLALDLAELSLERSFRVLGQGRGEALRAFLLLSLPPRRSARRHPRCPGRGSIVFPPICVSRLDLAVKQIEPAIEPLFE